MPTADKFSYIINSSIIFIFQLFQKGCIPSSVPSSMAGGKLFQSTVLIYLILKNAKIYV